MKWLIKVRDFLRGYSDEDAASARYKLLRHKTTKLTVREMRAVMAADDSADYGC